MREVILSVLVIEDEADIRQLLRTLLEREGFAVAEAAEGRDGVGNSTSAIPRSSSSTWGSPTWTAGRCSSGSGT